jgi:hypothetical protein
MSHDKIPNEYFSEQRMRDADLGSSHIIRTGKAMEYLSGVIPGSAFSKSPQGGVSREMQQMEKILSSLASAIDVLDSRLSMASIVTPPINTTSRGVDSMGSPLACQLSEFNQKLSEQTNRIEAICQGVDL